MKKLSEILDNNWLFLYAGTFVLCVVAYFINLGLTPLFADEPTRAVVALEMMYSDNYWVPTINGEYYYRKPPLYNWIIILFWKVSGTLNELVFRLPSVIPLFLYGLTIYYWVKKNLDKTTAFLSAVMFVTCGRMLVYASFIGHIDIFYSWITFLSFMVFIESLKTEDWWKFFIYTYALSAVAFMCKGLPTVVFQGFTIIALLIYAKRFKRFFSVQHLVGIIVFLIPVGGYFLKYYSYNSLEGWVYELWDQSAQRTPADKPWHETALHLIKFPLDHLYHLAPWSLFGLFLLKKQVRATIWNHSFLKPLLIILLVNIPVYWLSPGYYPRYLFMLYPIVFIALSYAYVISKGEKLKRFFYHLFGILTVLAILGLIGFKVSGVLAFLDWWQLIICLLVSFIAIWCIYRLKQHRYVGLVLTIIAIRFMFNWSVTPYKLTQNRELEYKNEALKMVELSEGYPIQVLHPTPINHSSTYYIEREKKEILPYSYKMEEGKFHLVITEQVTKKNLQVLDSMTIKYGNSELFLVKK